MQYELFKNAIACMEQAYNRAARIAQNLSNSLSPSRLELAIEGLASNYTSNNWRINEVYIRLQDHRTATSHQMRAERNRRPSGPEPYYSGILVEAIDWRGVDDPYQKAMRIVAASKLKQDDPRYKLTERPSSEDKEWARITLREPRDNNKGVQN